MRLSLVICTAVLVNTALAVPRDDSGSADSAQRRGLDGIFDGINDKGQPEATGHVDSTDAIALPAVTHPPEDPGIKPFLGFSTSVESTTSKSKAKETASSTPTATSYSVIGTLPPLQTPNAFHSAFAPAAPTTSSLEPSSTDQAAATHSSASSGTSEWKIIGVAVIAFTTVAGILLLSVFFDHWWRFVRDLFGRRRRRKETDEELVPDWEKAEWHLRFGQDRQRYPSFGSLPSIARVQPPPAAAAGPSRSAEAAGKTLAQPLGQAADMAAGHSPSAGSYSAGSPNGVGLGFGRVGSVRGAGLTGRGSGAAAGRSSPLSTGQRVQEEVRNPFEDDARSAHMPEDVYGGVED